MNKTLQNFLICPNCNELDSLIFLENSVECKGCNKTYIVINNRLLLIDINEQDSSNLYPKKPGEGSFSRR